MPAVAPAPSPVAPHMQTPMPMAGPDSVPFAPPHMQAQHAQHAQQALGRSQTTSPRAFVPPSPRSGPQAATVKLGSMPPSSRGGGAAVSTQLKIAIAAGGLIAVLLVFGVLMLGKMVFRSVASSEVTTTTQTTSLPPAAAPGTAKTRDPVVVPLDAAARAP